MKYAIIGAGPAGICAVAKLYQAEVPGQHLFWIDPQFQVGDFGSTLSQGSSVPGNTSVESYQKVIQALYELFPETDALAERGRFAINALPLQMTCPLKIAAQPLLALSKRLAKKVVALKGTVLDIHQDPHDFCLSVAAANKKIQTVHADRVILALGAKPKTLDLPKSLSLIHPHTVFIESELRGYLDKHPGIKKVAVIGSSHSAALATMHLLRAGIQVKQFMNKEYQFAVPALSAEGRPYTQFDNSGLKGEVAAFTRQLLQDCANRRGSYSGCWQPLLEKPTAAALEECSHAVICIGYAPASSLRINNQPLSAFKHDRHTTEIKDGQGNALAGLFGVGIAFPLEIQALSGEREWSVGVEKFWNNFDKRILEVWRRGD